MKVLLTSIIVFILTPLVWGQHDVVPVGVDNSHRLQLASMFLNQYAKLVNATPTESVKDQLRRAREDGFRYLKGDDEAMRQLTGKEDFDINFDKGVYIASWSVGGNSKVTCSFPANIGLLTFMNKIELENKFIFQLKENSLVTQEIKFPMREITTLTPVAYSDFYLEDKGFYITPRLKHQVVFEPEEKGSTKGRLLIDTDHYRMESLANMMLTGYTPISYNVNLNVNKYGYGSQTVNIPFSSLYKLMADEGSTPYWGVETFDGSVVKGLWVWINTEGGYAHMLSVKMPITDDASIDAKLHCYLRLDNLKSMFEEYPEL